MAEMKGGRGDGLSSKGKRSKSDAYVPNKGSGLPVQGLGLTRGTSAGTPKAQADLKRKGSSKA